MVIEHECTPPPSSANIAATFICYCGARWDTYPADETPTWRLLTGDDSGPAWRRGSQVSHVLTPRELR